MSHEVRSTHEVNDDHQNMKVYGTIVFLLLIASSYNLFGPLAFRFLIIMARAWAEAKNLVMKSGDFDGSGGEKGPLEREPMVAHSLSLCLKGFFFLLQSRLIRLLSGDHVAQVAAHIAYAQRAPPTVTFRTSDLICGLSSRPESQQPGRSLFLSITTTMSTLCPLHFLARSPGDYCSFTFNFLELLYSAPGNFPSLVA
jgi:hypothetical protein